MIQLASAALFGAVCLATPPTVQNGNPSTIESRVEKLLSQLTLDEKLSMIGGHDGFYTQGIPRLGIPDLKMSDGPMGVRNYGPTTAYAAGANLAASWNLDLAQKFGEAMGRDARSRGVHFILGPGVNLARIPQCGRNFEYYGEDPVLSGRIAAGAIKGMQSQGVSATIKHYAANNHEWDRNRDDSVVDERTLRELYLKQFEIAIKEAHPWALMDSYNLVNGIHASENDWLQNQVLKKEWGFQGIVMSDWGAAHSAKGCALGGLDLEMPGPAFMSARNLKPLIDKGEVPVSVIDDKVRRLLRVAVALKFLDRPQTLNIPKDDPRNAATTLQMAREGIVLLKNKSGILPLAHPKKILVVGMNAVTRNAGGGGSAYTEPFSYVTVVDAIKKAAGPGTQVVYRPPFEPKAVFGNSDAFDGPLKAEYFSNPDLKGEPVLVRNESTIDHDWESAKPDAPVGQENFSVRWTGKVHSEKGGQLMLVCQSDDGMRVFVDGRQWVDMWGDHGVQNVMRSIRFRPGQTRDIKVEYQQFRGLAVAQVGLVPLEQLASSGIAPSDLAGADAVVACTGFTAGTESEGMDRAFELPGDQEAMVEYLVAHSPKVVVVNNSGAGVDMSAWANGAAAILQAWFPGQNGNHALAEILFGKTNPSGKLPTTFPRKLAGTYYESAFPPKAGKVVYSEGLLMGYRWFDAKKVAPLFPFGYGLSYTTFKIDAVKVKGGKNVTVSLQVKNTGKVAGAETVQVYVARPAREGDPVRELKGFQKVWLQPGETKPVAIAIPLDSLTRYDIGRHAWVLDPGIYTVSVGASSRDLPYSQTIKL